MFEFIFDFDLYLGINEKCSNYNLDIQLIERHICLGNFLKKADKHETN
jgi:hypothetical protein